MKDEHDQEDPPTDSQRKRKRGATKDQAPEKLNSVVLANGNKPDSVTESLTPSTKATRSHSDSSAKAPPSKKAKSATTPEKALEVINSGILASNTMSMLVHSLSRC